MQKRRLSGRRPLLLAVGAGVTAAALAAGMTSAFAATVFSDDFTDGDTSGWSKSGGTWAVDGSGVLNQSNTGSELARQFAGQTSWTNYSVQARVRPTSFGSSSALVGLAARSSSSTKMYRLALLGSGRAELQAVNGSSVTAIGSAALGIGTGSWYTLRIETSGSTIRGFVNGAQIASGSKQPGRRGPHRPGHRVRQRRLRRRGRRLVRRRHPDHAATDHHSATDHAAADHHTSGGWLADAHQQPEGGRDDRGLRHVRRWAQALLRHR
ncbi:hypothetical protein ACFYL6_04905 [Micromonospora sp. NPDC007208]|uniref:hypothetical protein n=1 Tax=Micromonospora sp. NPDC007208 TaxID=3364236 RepID=UPI0036C33ABC